MAELALFTRERASDPTWSFPFQLIIATEPLPTSSIPLRIHASGLSRALVLLLAGCTNLEPSRCHHSIRKTQRPVLLETGICSFLLLPRHTTQLDTRLARYPEASLAGGWDLVNLYFNIESFFPATNLNLNEFWRF